MQDQPNAFCDRTKIPVGAECCLRALEKLIFGHFMKYRLRRLMLHYSTCITNRREKLVKGLPLVYQIITAGLGLPYSHAHVLSLNLTAQYVCIIRGLQFSIMLNENITKIPALESRLMNIWFFQTWVD